MKTHKCPYCGSCNIRKNGNANGVPRIQCRHCRHNFTFPENRSKYKSYTPDQKKAALVAYCSNKNLAEFSEKKLIPRELIYFWAKHFQRRIYFKKGVLAKVSMTNEQKQLYENFLKSHLTRNVRLIYNKTISQLDRRRPYQKILDFLAKNYDLLPTKRDPVEDADYGTEDEV